jgi:hypothetical protein
MACIVMTSAYIDTFEGTQSIARWHGLPTIVITAASTMIISI